MILRFEDFINEEIEFNLIPCGYTSSKISHLGYDIDSFTFTTNKQNSYTVYIHYVIESNHRLDDGTLLQNLNKNKDGIIPTIYFSESDRGLDPESFDVLSNKGEFMEVMGKVIFIISDFINKNIQYSLFSIGEVSEGKENFYRNWLKNLDISDIKIGPSDNYFDKNGNPIKSYYLVK